MALPPFLTPCHLFDTGPGTARAHMALDERLLGLIEGGLQACVLRFFGWSSPEVTYGRTQPPLPPPAVRRPTGGGVVYHEPGEMSFSFAWPARPAGRLYPLVGQSARCVYAFLHGTFRDALKEAGWNCALQKGVRAGGGGKAFECFRDYSDFDVLENGRKVLGGALRRTRHAFLYQGTLRPGPRAGGCWRTEVRRLFSSHLARTLSLEIIPSAPPLLSDVSRASSDRSSVLRRPPPNGVSRTTLRKRAGDAALT